MLNTKAIVSSNVDLSTTVGSQPCIVQVSYREEGEQGFDRSRASIQSR